MSFGAIYAIMKQLNYKIKKGHVSYLWRGQGGRLYRSLYIPKWYDTFYKFDFTQNYVRIDTKIYGNVNSLKK